MYTSSSSRPTPPLLWQVLIVLSTCSSTNFDSSATVCTSSCASSHCPNSRCPFSHLGPTSLANLFASAETMRSPVFCGTCGLFSSRPRGRIEDCSFFQICSVCRRTRHRLSNGLHRLKVLSGNPPGGRRASHACTNSAILLLLAQQSVVPQRSRSSFRLLQHHHALYCRFHNRLWISCASVPVLCTSSYISMFT